jgi:hypothetical protein
MNPEKFPAESNKGPSSEWLRKVAELESHVRSVSCGAFDQPKPLGEQVAEIELKCNAWEQLCKHMHATLMVNLNREQSPTKEAEAWRGVADQWKKQMDRIAKVKVVPTAYPDHNELRLAPMAGTDGDEMLIDCEPTT